jgi:hypothetical protein
MLKKDRYRGNTFFKNPEYLDAIISNLRIVNNCKIIYNLNKQENAYIEKRYVHE